MTRRSLPMDTATNARTTVVVELGAGAAHELGAGGLGGERILVGASRGHHVERIGHRDDPRGQADLRCPAGPAG